MRDFKHQLNKTEKLVTDLATKVLECYYDFLDVFLKKASDKIFLYSKYDHKIKLPKKDKNHSHMALQGMFKLQLKYMKKFFEEHFKKDFIEANKVPCFSLILLARKSSGGVKFSLNYRKLNALTKKNAYPIPLIIETLAQLKKAKVFTKINIRRTFHKLYMAASSENLTTMAMRFSVYK